MWFQTFHLDSTTPSTLSAKLVRLLEHKYWGEETFSVGEGQEELTCLSLGGSIAPKINLILEAERARTSILKVNLGIEREKIIHKLIGLLKIFVDEKINNNHEGTCSGLEGLEGSAAKASSSRGRSRAGSTKPRGFAMKRTKGGEWRPKRALAPYMFFCKAQRENITSDNPNISFGDIGRILGSQWQNMSEKDKKPFIRKAEADKKRYQRELKRCKNR